QPPARHAEVLGAKRRASKHRLADPLSACAVALRGSRSALPRISIGFPTREHLRVTARSSLHQRDRADVAAVVGLAAMGCAAIAEEIFRFRVGAAPEVLDPADLRAFEPGEDMAGEVEPGVAVGLGTGKEPRVLRIGLQEAR